MKKILTSFLVLVFPILFLVSLNLNLTDENLKKENEKEGYQSEGDIQKSAAYKEMHRAENSLTPDEKLNIWKQVEALPEENKSINLNNDWKSIGPYGIDEADGRRFSGRVLDLKHPTGNAGLRIASAMGGLWEYSIFIASPISDNLPTLSIGSFDSHPDSSDVIIIGTGEPRANIAFGLSRGTGMYKTTNKGSSWSQISLTPTPNNFHKIRYSINNKQIVFAATDIGLYKSTTGGNTFTLNRSGEYSDFIYDQNFPGTMFAAKMNEGLIHTTNYGETWDSAITGLPPDYIGDIKLDIAKTNSTILYASISSDTICPNTGGAIGMKVYKSTNSGFNGSD